MALAALLALVCVPSPARALSGGMSGGELHLTDDGSGSGVQNTVVIGLSGGELVVTDALTSITDADGVGGCGLVATELRCPAGAVQAIVVDARGGDDSIDIDAAVSVGSRIDGGNGSDTLQGGAGDDLLNGGTKPNEADSLFGGAGIDTADYSDHGSKVTVDLEGDADDGKPGAEFDSVGTDIENITGSTDDDTLVGSAQPNVLRGENGDDTLSGGAGDDQLFGGKHKDSLDGGANADLLSGGTHDDVLDGASGDDRLLGGDGKDSYAGGTGEDTLDFSDKTVGISVNLIGSTATVPADGLEILVPDASTLPPEHVVGGSGDDVIVGSAVTNRIDGGPGSDQISGGNGVDYVDYSAYDDDLRLTADGSADDGGAADGHADNIAPDVEGLTGGSGNDVLIGAGIAENPNVQGLNRLHGGPGNDYLDGGTGPDEIVGGSGLDSVTYASRTADLAISLDGRADDGESERGVPGTPGFALEEGDNVHPDVEVVAAGSGDDRLVGSEIGPGDDGADLLLGGDGADNLSGIGGDDTLRGEGGNDVSFSGGPGADLIDAGSGDDLIQPGQGSDLLVGGSGVDRLDYSGALTPVSISQNGVADDGTVGQGHNVAPDIEELIGGSAGDVLLAAGANNLLEGGGGGDWLDGGAGADTLLGGGGVDVVSYGSHSAGVVASLDGLRNDGAANEQDLLGADVESLEGTNSSDVLAGNDSANLISGRAGDDLIFGGGGSDDLAGGAGSDQLLAGPGNDSVAGDAGNDSLTGGSGADDLLGGEGDDRLDGSAGPDVFFGGAGTDVADYGARPEALALTIDGLANDGSKTGEGDNIGLDVENLIAGAGPDEISGSFASNTILGGAGDDSIDVVDGVADSVDCGSGRNSVRSDSVDRLVGDCVTVRLASAEWLRIRSSSVRPNRRGKVRVAVQCVGVPVCTGVLRLARAGKSVARRRVSIRAGKRARRIVLRLNRKTRSRLKRRSLRVNVAAVADKGVGSQKVVTVKRIKNRRAR